MFGYHMIELTEETAEDYVDKCMSVIIAYGEKLTMAGITNRFYATAYGVWEIYRILLECTAWIKSHCYW